MRKWLKRCLAAVAVILFAAIVFCSGALILYKSSPPWYRPRSIPAEQAAMAAASAENKLTEAQSWAATFAADQARAVYAARAGEQGLASPATRAAPSHVVTFSEQELNALLDKWSSPLHWTGRGGRGDQILSAPAIVLEKGRLILAAN